MDILTSNMVDVAFGLESTFGTTPGTVASIFGLEQKLSVNTKRNTKRFHDLGQRAFINARQLKFEASWDVDFVLANELFWPLVLCSGDGTGMTPYIFDPDGSPKFASILQNDRGEGQLRYLRGCVDSDFSMAVNVGDEIKCKMSGLCKDIGGKAASVTRASLSLDGNALTDDPFTFADGAYSFGGQSNEFGLIQKLDLKLGNDLEFYWSFGDEKAHTPKHKKAIGGLTMGVKKSDSSNLQGIDVIDPASSDGEEKAAVITLSDGTRTITMTLSLVFMDEFSTGYEVAQDIDENIVCIFSDISVVLAGF